MIGYEFNSNGRCHGEDEGICVDAGNLIGAYLDTNRLYIWIIKSARRDAADFVASQVDVKRSRIENAERGDVGDLI